MVSALLLSFALHLSTPAATKAGQELPLLVVEVKAGTLAKLERTREQLLRAEVLEVSKEEELEARLRFEEGAANRPTALMASDIRLAPRTREELQSGGWPLRIELHGDGHVLGMRRFTLRAGLAGGTAMLLDQLRREGVLAPRIHVARVRLGSRHLGPRVLEEHYAKELLESQQRREGVLLRFEAPEYFAGERAAGVPGGAGGFYLARLLPYRAARLAKSEPLSADLATATGLMRGFLQGELPAHQVFEPGSMSSFLAVVELWGARNAFEWPNLRFYFNPVIQRLEPIAFAPDAEPARPDRELVTQRAPWARLLLEDPELRSAFRRRVRELAADMVRGSEAPRLHRAGAAIPRPLRSGDPAAELRRVAERASRLSEMAWKLPASAEPASQASARAAPSEGRAAPEVRRAAATTPASPSGVLRAYRGSDAGREYLELANRLAAPLRLLEVRFTGLEPWQQRDFVLRAPSRLPVELPALSPTGRPHFVQLLFRPPRVEPPGLGFEVAAVAQGIEYRGPIEVLPYFPALSASPIPTAALSETLARHPFLRWDESTAMLRAPAGTWKLAGSLVLPEGVGLELSAGTALQFPDDGLILATGPLRFRGDADRPVILEGQPGRGGIGTWQGVVVLESERPHEWEHVIVRNTRGAERNTWKLTGGVTMRASEVRISKTTFEGNRGEDALNLIRSRFELDQVSIQGTLSDAFDCDFCSGRVSGGHFARIGGDAIDVSGSEITVQGATFEEVGDKALSVGERSRLTARGVEIRGAGTAVASKDGSEVRLAESNISGVPHAALMAYTKKPEFGPARLVADELRIEKVGRTALAQRGSSIRIDGVEQTPEDIDIDALYRHGYMRK